MAREGGPHLWVPLPNVCHLDSQTEAVPVYFAARVALATRAVRVRVTNAESKQNWQK
jgi:hypothetical protein